MRYVSLRISAPSGSYGMDDLALRHAFEDKLKSEGIGVVGGGGAIDSGEMDVDVEVPRGTKSVRTFESALRSFAKASGLRVISAQLSNVR